MQAVDSTFGVLRRLRIHFKGRVSKTNLLDLQGPLTKVLRARYRDHRIEIWANETFLLLGVYGTYGYIGGMRLRLAGSVLSDRDPIRLIETNGRRYAIYSVVPPDSVVPLDAPTEKLRGSDALARLLDNRDPIRFLETSAGSYAVYSVVRRLDTLMEGFLRSDALARLLERVGIADYEGVLIDSNQIRTRLYKPGFKRALESIDAILDLIPESEVVEKRDCSDLPPEFAPLLPLLPTWDLSDDEARWQKVKRSSKASRRKLIEAVNPFMAGISAYLETFHGREMTDGASALDSLAQAAMEADVSLKAQA